MQAVKRLRNLPFRWLPLRFTSSCSAGDIPMDPKGKIVCVTGAADGIGLEMCKYLLEAGCRICASDYNYELGAKTIEEIKPCAKEGAEIFFTKCDVTRHGDFATMISETMERYGCPDIMVNNAGILNDKRWYETVDTNAQGTVRGTFLSLDFMSKKNGGKGGLIVNNASILGFQPFRGAPVYTATKHFVVGFTRSLGDEWHHKQTGVRVCAICPGVTDTDMVRNAHQRQMNAEWSEIAGKDLAALPPQKVETTSECFMWILKCAPSGTCWIAEGGEYYEVKVPDRRTFRDAK